MGYDQRRLRKERMTLTASVPRVFPWCLQTENTPTMVLPNEVKTNTVVTN